MSSREREFLRATLGGSREGAVFAQFLGYITFTGKGGGPLERCLCVVSACLSCSGAVFGTAKDMGWLAGVCLLENMYVLGGRGRYGVL